MKRACLFLVYILLFSIDCFSQRQPPYFSRNSYFFNKCDYIVKGEIIDKKAVAYMDYTDYDITDSIVSVKIRVTDSFGYDMNDTIWVYPNFENYFNRQKEIDTSNRDSVWYLQFEDVNYESCCFFIHYDKEYFLYNGFIIGEVGYFRFWKENDTYVYCLEDSHFPLNIRDDKMLVEINRWDRFIDNLFPLVDRFHYVGVERFERKLKRKIK